MKKIVSSLVAVFSLLILANCTATNATPKTSSENVNREWMLIEFQDFSKTLMTKNKANLNLTEQDKSGRFSANMGCNNIFGQVKFSANGKVKFSEIGSTMMFCDKNMNLESAFGRELPNMVEYSIEGHFLTLMNIKGTQMKFVAADWD